MLKQLASLPRDARDTLFLLAVIALIVLPQVENLPVLVQRTTAQQCWSGAPVSRCKPSPCPTSGGGSRCWP